LVPDTLHTPVSLEESTENTTGLPDPPPVADKVADPVASPNPVAERETRSTGLLSP
jgi:hypothetical protein